jgi:hypothetical protein
MKSKPTPTRTLIREYISDLKGERKENLKEYKFLVKQDELGAAMHLDSVNECLDYVIDNLERILREAKELEK